MLGVEDTAFLPLGGVPSTLSHCALPAEHRGGSSSALLVASASTLSVVGSDAAGEPVHATALRVPLLGAASPDSAHGGAAFDAGEEASPTGVDIVSVACVPSDQPSVQPFAIAVAALRSGGPAGCIDAADTKAPTDAVLFVFGEASPSHASLQVRLPSARAAVFPAQACLRKHVRPSSRSQKSLKADADGGRPGNRTRCRLFALGYVHCAIVPAALCS